MLSTLSDIREHRVYLFREMGEESKQNVDDPVVVDPVVLSPAVDSGETGVILATPSQNEARNTKKRKQYTKTDFFVKKHINKK